MGQGADIPLALVWMRLSKQIAAHAQTAQALEHVVTRTGAQPIPDAVMMTLQEVDFLRQSLDDLAKLTALLGQHDVDGGITAQEARAIKDGLTLTVTRAILEPDGVKAPREARSLRAAEPEIF